MTEFESHTLAHLRRLDEKVDRYHAETGARLDRLEGRLGRIEDELLVLNGIALRLEGREIETTGLKAILDRHERWLGELGSRLAELEGPQKGWARAFSEAADFASFRLRPWPWRSAPEFGRRLDRR